MFLPQQEEFRRLAMLLSSYNCRSMLALFMALPSSSSGEPVFSEHGLQVDSHSNISCRINEGILNGS